MLHSFADLPFTTQFAVSILGSAVLGLYAWLGKNDYARLGAGFLAAMLAAKLFFGVLPEILRLAILNTPHTELVFLLLIPISFAILIAGRSFNAFFWALEKNDTELTLQMVLVFVVSIWIIVVIGGAVAQRIFLPIHEMFNYYPYSQY